MIKNITITGVKYELTDTTKKYVERKIGALGKYLPRHARKSATADVKIKCYKTCCSPRAAYCKTKIGRAHV